MITVMQVAMTAPCPVVPYDADPAYRPGQYVEVAWVEGDDADAAETCALAEAMRFDPPPHQGRLLGWRAYLRGPGSDAIPPDSVLWTGGGFAPLGFDRDNGFVLAEDIHPVSGPERVLVAALIKYLSPVVVAAVNRAKDGDDYAHYDATREDVA